MQYSPDWLIGMVPPSWWPDRPREVMFYGVNLLPVVGPDSVEMVFDKRRDVLVWGGCVLVTDSAGTGIFDPISGTNTQLLVRMRNPAGNIVFSSGTVVGSGNEPGFMPLENLFSAWHNVARRPAYWPIPIPIPKGGSLAMDLIDVNPGGSKFVRFTFWVSLMYEERILTA